MVNVKAKITEHVVSWCDRVNCTRHACGLDNYPVNLFGFFFFRGGSTVDASVVWRATRSLDRDTLVSPVDYVT